MAPDTTETSGAQPATVNALAAQVALVLERLGALTTLVRESRDEQRAINADHETRLRSLEAEQASLSGRIDRVSDRIPLWQGAQATYATAAAFLSWLFGNRP